MEIQEKQFEEVLKDVLAKYEAKKEKYGESWKEMEFIELVSRFWGECEELGEANTDEEIDGELSDVILLALMLKARLKRL